MVMGFAWYRPQDYQHLLDISADAKDLEDSHEKWLASASRAMRKMRREGIQARRVIVDLDELQAWCETERIPIDSAARARFVAEKLRTL
jgi:hypothetical protein